MAKKTDPTPDPTETDERLAELTADLQRLQAEFANYRRRAEAERAEVLDFAKNRIVREFLTVRDSFDQEQAHRPQSLDATWAASIDSIRAQLDKVLTTLGVARFESKGQAFDPHLHEAIAMEEGSGDHDVVTEELQAGYKLGETVLRHAVVKVGRTEQAPAAASVPAATPTPASEPVPASASEAKPADVTRPATERVADQPHPTASSTAEESQA